MTCPSVQCLGFRKYSVYRSVLHSIKSEFVLCVYCRRWHRWKMTQKQADSVRVNWMSWNSGQKNWTSDGQTTSAQSGLHTASMLYSSAVHLCSESTTLHLLWCWNSYIHARRESTVCLFLLHGTVHCLTFKLHQKLSPVISVIIWQLVPYELAYDDCYYY